MSVRKNGEAELGTCAEMHILKMFLQKGYKKWKQYPFNPSPSLEILLSLNFYNIITQLFNASGISIFFSTNSQDNSQFTKKEIHDQDNEGSETSQGRLYFGITSNKPHVLKSLNTIL